MQGAKGTAAPGEKDREMPWKEEELAEKLGALEARAFRWLAARANYLAADRPDIQYAVKQLCRGMANPDKGDMAKLRRLARYLISRPRLVWRFRYQEEDDEIRAYSDSDWAGCRRTAKSTSGGAIMIGGHLIKTWASTQKNVTLSSGEAELVAAVKASTEAIGVMQMASEWGRELEGQVLVDSSAALGAVKRKGNGKLRHVKVGMLWIQEKQENGELEYVKVKGEENPADMMTKYLNRPTAEKLQQHLQLHFEDGRSDVSLTL